MDQPLIKYLLIGGSVYLLSQYGCKTVCSVIRTISKMLKIDYVGMNNFFSQFFSCFKSNYMLKNMQINLAYSEQETTELLKTLNQEAKLHGFIGLDCEWVNGKPVALVQLSTKEGYCVLVHLSQMQSFPQALKDILEDDTILKVGVGVQNDAKLLFRDYKVETRGCLDLRFLAPIRPKMGLAALASDHLNITLEKSSRIRRSDWAAETLSEEQRLYAGQDAYVGALLFKKLIQDKLKKINYVRMSDWHSVVVQYIGTNFKGSRIICKTSSTRRTGKVKDENECHYASERKALRAYTPRKTPIYSNCKMLAPDGEVLCTCSRKKADWYITQGLAKEICLDPYKIQLLFEPAERFQSASGLYYIQDKVNQCVVCGKKDSHLRKSVVPHEYRRHFPDSMKKHQSHDVLPLCQLCHLRSNSADIALRQRLAERCNALIGVGHDVKATDDQRLKKLRSAARALLHGGDRIKESRRQELKQIIREELPYYEEQLKIRFEDDGAGDTDTLSLQDLPLDEVLPKLRDIDISIANNNYIPHGLKVTEYFAKDGIPGLMKLEKIWREHFVESMKPGFLPNFWSVSHYHHNERVFEEDQAFQDKMQKIKLMEDRN